VNFPYASWIAFELREVTTVLLRGALLSDATIAADPTAMVYMLAIIFSMHLAIDRSWHVLTRFAASISPLDELVGATSLRQ
jgi:hypothetical protein